MKYKLKTVDGLDIEEIRRKDFELRSKMQQGQRIVNPNLNFDFDNTNGDIRVQEDHPVALKNEVQRNFLDKYNS